MERHRLETNSAIFFLPLWRLHTCDSDSKASPTKSDPAPMACRYCLLNRPSKILQKRYAGHMVKIRRGKWGQGESFVPRMASRIQAGSACDRSNRPQAGFGSRGRRKANERSCRSLCSEQLDHMIRQRITWRRIFIGLCKVRSRTGALKTCPPDSMFSPCTRPSWELLWSTSEPPRVGAAHGDLI